ncbi:MAG: BRCT domain-containing protein [Planctomycetota bacterium]|jgi:hypothetical protein
MTKEIGLYMAVAFLGLCALITGMLFYQRQLDKQALTEQLERSTPKEFIDKYGNENIRNLQIKAQTLEEEMDGYKKEVEAIQSKFDAEVKKVEEGKSTIVQFVKQRDEQLAVISEKEKKIETLETTVTELQNKLAEPDPVVKQLKIDIDQTKVRSEELNRQAMRTQQARKMEQENYKAQIAQLKAEVDKLRRIIDEYKFIDKKRAQTVVEQYDGKTLNVDIDRGFVVINLGKVHRIKIGMHFNVIRRVRDQWKNMGAIEIVKVMPATSTAVIVTRIDHFKECPLCGYKGSAEMRNCPFCRVGAGSSGDDMESAMGKKYVPLVSGEIKEQSTMDPLDPIIAGDYITNPLYSRDKVITFTVAGRPTEYSLPELKTLVKKYGGVITDKIDVETDYLILCQIPDQGSATTKELQAEYNAAVDARDAANQYGIPIMREVELLRFIKK